MCILIGPKADSKDTPAACSGHGRDIWYCLVPHSGLCYIIFSVTLSHYLLISKVWVNFHLILATIIYQDFTDNYWEWCNVLEHNYNEI